MDLEARREEVGGAGPAVVVAVPVVLLFPPKSVEVVPAASAGAEWADDVVVLLVGAKSEGAAEV